MLTFVKKLCTSAKKFLLDMLFPIFCLSCRQEGQWLCLLCAEKINDFSYKNPLLKKALHLFKYQGIEALAKPLGEIFSRKFQQSKFSLNDFDFIVPVPLHQRRRRTRGFNQAEVLARALDAQKTNCSILLRPVYRKPQVELKEAARKENIKNCFFCPSRKKIKDKNILLIDDMKTTGATVRECRLTLLRAGAKKVSDFTLLES